MPFDRYDKWACHFVHVPVVYIVELLVDLFTWLNAHGLSVHLLCHQFELIVLKSKVKEVLNTLLTRITIPLFALKDLIVVCGQIDFMLGRFPEG